MPHLPQPIRQRFAHLQGNPSIPMAPLLDQSLWLPVEVTWSNHAPLSRRSMDVDLDQLIDNHYLHGLWVIAIAVSVAIIVLNRLPAFPCCLWSTFPIVWLTLLVIQQPTERHTWVLNNKGLTRRSTGLPAEHTAWDDLNTRVIGTAIRIYGTNRALLMDSGSFAGVERIALSLIVGLAHQRLPVWKQQLWAGEMVDFDGLRLGLTCVELVARGQVIERKDVGLWRTETETLLFHDRSGGVVGTVPISDLLNPDLLWELLEEWGMDTANPTPVEDVIITGRTPHDTTP